MKILFHLLGEKHDENSKNVFSPLRLSRGNWQRGKHGKHGKQQEGNTSVILWR